MSNDYTSVTDLEESLFDTSFSITVKKPEMSPESKFRLYQKTHQKESSRELGDGVLREYKSFAKQGGYDPTEQECVNAYKDWMLSADVDKTANLVGTAVTKLSHVKTWIKEAHGK